MDRGLLIICALTFVIHLIGTLAYSVRIAGSRTRRVALSLSLFNILVLVSRTSNSFQAPLLAKRIEENIAAGVIASSTDFRWLLAAASIATIVGALLIPTFQRLFARYVEAFGRYRSMSGIAMRLFSTRAVAVVRASAVLPRWNNLTAAQRGPHIPWLVAALNVVAMAITMKSATRGVSVWVDYLRPEASQ